jgi:type VI secretion system protein ImpC
MNFSADSLSFLPNSEGSLPFKVLICAPLMSDIEDLERHQPVEIQASSINQTMANMAPSVSVFIDNAWLCELMQVDRQSLQIDYQFNQLDDFLPECIIEKDPYLKEIADIVHQLHQRLQQGKFHFSADDFQCDRIQLDVLKQEHIKRKDLEILVCDLEKLLSSVIDKVIHNPSWQTIESAWRSVCWLCDIAANYSNCIIEVLPVCKQALWDDLSAVSDVDESIFYQYLYMDNLGQFGGIPYGSVILDEYFTGTGSDITLLKLVANVCAQAHVPLITGTAAGMFEVSDYRDLMNVSILHELHASHRFIKWRSLVQTTDASYLSMVVGRMRVRAQYNKQTQGLYWYQEGHSDSIDEVCWSNGVYAFASNLLRSFGQHGFCNMIAGNSDGVVDTMMLNQSEHELPVEILLSESKQTELINLGFNPLCYRQASSTLLFQTANSVRWAAIYYERRRQTHDSMASAQLQYLYIILRIIHCIKILFRESLGSITHEQELENKLNRWIRQYVSDVESPVKEVLAKRPLRDGKVEVTTSEDVGWFDIQLDLVPHMKYMGEFIALNATVPMTKEAG